MVNALIDQNAVLMLLSLSASTLGATFIDFFAFLLSGFLSETYLSISFDFSIYNPNPLTGCSLRAWHLGCFTERGLRISVTSKIVEAHAERNLNVVRALESTFANRCSRRCDAITILTNVQIGVSQSGVNLAIS